MPILQAIDASEQELPIDDPSNQLSLFN
jgi:hypothetical protein